MAQQVRCLLCKHEDLNVDPTHTWEARHVVASAKVAKMSGLQGPSGHSARKKKLHSLLHD